jgi:lipid A 4'-phosphatase
MIAKNSRALKHTATQIAVFAVPAVAGIWFVWASGLDNWLAHALYNPQSAWAWALREHSAKPSFILAVLALLVCLVPGVWHKKPVLYHSALALLVGAVLGAGLLNQVLLQEVFNRPRPREGVLLDLPTAHNLQNAEGFKGNSMPSGHAAMGFVLVSPFFVLRRTRPRVAYGFLVAGTAAGLVIGAARMVLGAHFATDVLVAGLVALLVAYASHVAVQRWQRLPVRVLAGLLVLVAVGVVLGNKFEMTLNHQLTPTFTRVNLPCIATTVANSAATSPVLRVDVAGYGAPVTALKLHEKQGIISLDTTRGVYHSISCTAVLTVPQTWGE